jgi:hypothetical protein
LIEVKNQNLLAWVKKFYRYSETTVVYMIITALDYFEVLNHGATEIEVDDVKRNSDTLFIMGSGGSINDISESDRRTLVETGDVLAFNYFFRGEFVPVDFHIIREMEPCAHPWEISMLWRRKSVSEYCTELTDNEYYTDTTLFVLDQMPSLHDRASQYPQWALYINRCFSDWSICSYQNRQNQRWETPGKSIDDIVHRRGTLTDAINIGYVLGYNKIVLVGVDLYDREYYWKEEGKRRDIDVRRDSHVTDSHRTSSHMIKVTNRWSDYLAGHDVELSVENPKSLLHTEGTLPVYRLK